MDILIDSKIYYKYARCNAKIIAAAFGFNEVCSNYDTIILTVAFNSDIGGKVPVRKKKK